MPLIVMIIWPVKQYLKKLKNNTGEFLKAKIVMCIRALRAVLEIGNSSIFEHFRAFSSNFEQFSRISARKCSARIL